MQSEDATRTALGTLESEKTKLMSQLALQRSQSQNLQAFVEQAKGPAGVCPDESCGASITGLDLLRGRCPECGTALSSLPATSKPLDGQLLILIGAVGLLAGAVVWAASK